jgi:hypothetical protein
MYCAIAESGSFGSAHYQARALLMEAVLQAFFRDRAATLRSRSKADLMLSDCQKTTELITYRNVDTVLSQP